MFKGLGGVLGVDEGRGPAVEEDDAATSTDGSGNTGGDLDRTIESAEGLSVPREPEDLIDAISHSSPSRPCKIFTGSHVPNALLQLSCVCEETMKPVESCCLFRRRVGSCFNRFSASEKGLNNSRRYPLRPCFPPRTLSLMHRRTQREQERPFVGSAQQDLKGLQGLGQRRLQLIWAKH